ncbi:hypothetical protein F0562_024089 [Nyssa sinensis]|uniref:Reverse transcriptase/retrotransposon-derived protein RNase H-like domain-containing protein n=1 Tax=Nyssa sinensis TaxID=561372 RepID=A0A5J5BME4_9ASTE|nr:hypothetical protein F0562_024089 [Nyssa sinensis]
MTTNKERIENLEAGFGAVQDGLHQMELDMVDKLHHLEETLNPRAAPNAPVTLVRRLPWDEILRRRAQGLCFHYNERFIAGHRCQRPQLLLLEGPPDASNIICEEFTEQLLQKEDHGELPEHETEPEITLHALIGWTVPKTMQMMAKLGSHEVIVLVDSGSTHNFVSERIARLLRMPVVPTEPFTIRVANGENMKCQGRFEGVRVDLQDTPFSLTLYSFPLTGLDLVLGIQWLEMLGSVTCNWEKLTMEFIWQDRARKLQGLGAQSIREALLKELSKEFCQKHELFVVCFQLREETVLQENMPPGMQPIVEEYAKIFKEPVGLPPVCEVDHTIPLREGAEPINVCPYRCAHFQKNEIEKQVQDMLDTRLIHPSTSPFSLPVLLVKKKDGSWQFCTDYHALNVATIKDRHELHGALYGRPSPPILTYQDGLSPVNEVDQSLLSRDELLKKLKCNLEASINRMKQVADLKRRDVTFEVGDLVFLKLHSYRQQSTFRRAH